MENFEDPSARPSSYCQISQFFSVFNDFVYSQIISLFGEFFSGRILVSDEHSTVILIGNEP